ncbi:MAG: hypothetical protein K8T26_12340 [Lentisphaerae bacterium]|nr:hypothetical protein [Lentisphaerota bacterium]
MKVSTIGMMAAVWLAGGAAVAAEVSPSTAPIAAPSGWKGELTPYAWFMGIDGDVTVGGQKTEFDKSASDIFDAADFGGSLLAVAQYDRYLAWGQVDVLSTDTQNLDEEDQPQGGQLETKSILGEAAVGYQIDGWAEGQTFDLLVGVRTLHIENDLEIYGVGKADSENDLVDPIFIVRPSIPVFPSKIDGLRFNPTLGIGGGGDSDIVYELQPQLQYQITENLAARVGYRNVGYKFKGDNAENPIVKSKVTDDDELNINFSGMIVGLGVTF